MFRVGHIRICLAFTFVIVCLYYVCLLYGGPNATKKALNELIFFFRVSINLNLNQIYALPS